MRRDLAGAVVGAVLCGGASRRMGRDKAFVEVDGAPMVRRVADALRAGGCAEVVAVGGDSTALATLGLTVVEDEHPGEGPLGAIITALQAFPDAAAVVVVACDLPHLQPATVATLVATLEAPYGAAVAIPSGEHRPSLCGAWNPSVAAALAAHFAAGERRVRIALDDVPHVNVHVDPTELRNLNAPGDLRQ